MGHEAMGSSAQSQRRGRGEEGGPAAALGPGAIPSWANNPSAPTAKGESNRLYRNYSSIVSGCQPVSGQEWSRDRLSGARGVALSVKGKWSENPQPPVRRPLARPLQWRC